MDRTPHQVAGYLSDFRQGTGGEWDWDDFVSCPITDPVLESIRVEANTIRLPKDNNGIEKLRSLYERARDIS